MEITRTEEPTFIPVTIVLEKQEEVDILASILNYAPIHDCFNSRFLNLLHDKLTDFSDRNGTTKANKLVKYLEK